MNFRQSVNLSAISCLVAVAFLSGPHGAYSDDGLTVVSMALTPRLCGQIFLVECDQICRDAGSPGAQGFMAAKPYKKLHCICEAPERTPAPPFGPGPVFEF